MIIAVKLPPTNKTYTIEVLHMSSTCGIRFHSKLLARVFEMWETSCALFPSTKPIIPRRIVDERIYGARGMEIPRLLRCIRQTRLQVASTLQEL